MMALDPLMKKIVDDTMKETVNSIVKSIRKNVKPDAPTTWGEVAQVLENIKNDWEKDGFSKEE